MIVLYYFASVSKAPQYLKPVIDLMREFDETALRGRDDLNMLVMELKERLEACKSGRMKDSTAKVEVYSSQIILVPKSLTDEWVARLSFMKIDKRKKYNANLCRFEDLEKI